MDDVLKKLAPGHRARFIKEYISTDIVCYLSVEDFLKLGLIDCNAIIPLRIACSTFGLYTPQRAIRTNKFAIN